MSLHAAVARWHEQVEAYDPQLAFAPPQVFPFAGWDNVTTLCLNTVDGSVVLADPHDSEPLSDAWASLSAWITDLTTLWTSGAVAFTPNGTGVDRARWPGAVTRESYW